MAALGLVINQVQAPVTHPAEFQELYQRYSEIVYRTALRVTGKPSDAEDVLQTVFLRVLNSQLLVQPAWSPDRYFRRAATNASIDVIRRRSSQAEAPIEEGSMRSAHETSPLLKERLRRALATLPARDAELFVLCYLEGFSYDELADLFGMERGTVGSRLHRLRATLQKQLEK